jgi:hypothetical protein
MKTLSQRFIESLSEQEMISIIEGYEQFEKDGIIGDEPIRVFAVAFMKEIEVDSNVVVWMERLAFECYRHFAKKYIQAHFQV